MQTTSNVETAKASQYLGALCKHFGHRVPTKQEGNSGQIAFPFGQCDLIAHDTRLSLKASAETPADLERTVAVVTSHLERFAFRENPDITWQDGPIPHAA